MATVESENGDTMRIQECWKMMLQGCGMLKLNEAPTSSKNENKYSAEKLQQVALNEDFESISYVAGTVTETIEISSVRSVLTGEKIPEWIAENCAGVEDFSVNRCFTITTTEEDSYINCVAPSGDAATCWVRGLTSLIQNRTAMKEAEVKKDQWLRNVFSQLDETKTMKISYADLFEYLNSHRGVQITAESFKDKTKEFLRMKKRKEKSKDSWFSVEDFVELYKFIFRRKHIDFVFRTASANGAFVTAGDLESFLSREQHITGVTQEHCKELIRSFEVTQSGKANLELGIDGFMAYMNSTEAGLFNCAHEKVYQDMDQPLPHYYIASSHNTYLTGHQLKGYSSAQAYKDVLEKGGRCVELDCWDGDDDKPVVYHGHTLTSKIPFKDIIEAIKESAFKTSPYPVIVSLENHCSEEFQRKMSQHLVEILGDALYNEHVDSSLTRFPSPEYFKNKILVRGKKFKEENGDEIVQKEMKGPVKQATKQVSQVTKLEYQDTKPVNQDTTPESMPTTSGNQPDKQANLVMLNEKERKKSQQNGSETNAKEEHLAVSSKDENRLSPQSSPASRRRRLSRGKNKKTVAKELSEIINYVANEKFKSFIDSLTNGHFSHSSSFVESEMLHHVKESAVEFVEYNKSQLSRIYPGNLRIESSNYDPVTPWNVGCQIVALNHQTNSEQMHLHHGKFRQNGRAGYLLKPSFLRDPQVKFNPHPSDGRFPGIQSKHLSLTVISGQQLPTPVDSWSFVKDVPDPYVQVEIHGVPADEVTFTTKTLTDNSFNPVWNDTFEATIRVPELALVRFVVYDADYGFDDFIGQVVVPFESMLQGYRHIQLLDMNSEPIHCAFLFVHVNISDIAITSF